MHNGVNGGIAVNTPDPRQTLEAKEIAAKQEQVWIYQAKLQRVGLANAFLALPAEARSNATTEAANKAIAEFFLEPITLGVSETHGFIQS